MREFPNAKLVVHPRGARHMIDPTTLQAGVREVYGAEEADRMYAELTPVPKSRVIAPEDGHEIAIGGRSITCLHTPGHARHHMVYFDKKANGVFTGDAFGVTYGGLDVNGRRSVLPTTSPVQFDPEEMHRSVDRIAGLHPYAIYPTHFGQMRDVQRLAADLHRLIDEYVKAVVGAKGDYENTLATLEGLVDAEKIRQSWPVSTEELREAFRIELMLDAKGLCLWYAKRRGRSGA